MRFVLVLLCLLVLVACGQSTATPTPTFPPAPTAEPAPEPVEINEAIAVAIVQEFIRAECDIDDYSHSRSRWEAGLEADGTWRVDYIYQIPYFDWNGEGWMFHPEQTRTWLIVPGGWVVSEKSVC